jgi:hypothetical protein
MAANGIVVSANLLAYINHTYVDFQMISNRLHDADELIKDVASFNEYRRALQETKYALSDAFSTAKVAYMQIQARKNTLPPHMVTKMMNLMGDLIQEPENGSDYVMFPSKLPRDMTKAILAVSNAQTYLKFRIALPEAIFMAKRFASEWEEIYLIARDHAVVEAHENHPAGGFRYKKRTHRKRTHRNRSGHKRTHRNRKRSSNRK